MATTKPKVKRMMFGGVAKGVAAGMQGAAKKAVASKTAPKQMQFMSDMLRGAPMAINAAKNAAETQRVNQFNAMTPTQRQQAEIARTSGTIGQLSQMSPSGRQQAMTINAAKNAMETLRGNQLNAMTPAQRQQAEIARTSGTIGGTAAKALGLGMKKGGAVKSSASKRGDGIAQRGKTKGRIV